MRSILGRVVARSTTISAAQAATAVPRAVPLASAAGRIWNHPHPNRSSPSSPSRVFSAIMSAPENPPCRRSKVYTKTGDKGTTSLYNLVRLPKTADYFECLGAVDEANSTIGLAREYGVLEGNSLDSMLEHIQSRLFDVGAIVATPASSSNEKQLERSAFPEGQVDLLEQWIDELDAKLPPLKNFILPSGGLCSATLHMARTAARTAERRMVPLVERGDIQDAEVLRFMNRLSDFLFVAARTASQHLGKPESIWVKPRKPRAPREPASGDSAAAAAETPAEAPAAADQDAPAAETKP